MPRVVHFEIPAGDPAAMESFYSSVFGWRFEKWEGPMDYWLITTGDQASPGIDGAMMPRRDLAQSIVNTVDVESVDATAEAVAAAGGTVVVPKMAITGVGWLIYFNDPEGNMHGAMESDPAAA